MNHEVHEQEFMCCLKSTQYVTLPLFIPCTRPQSYSNSPNALRDYTYNYAHNRAIKLGCQEGIHSQCSVYIWQRMLDFQAQR